MCQCSAGNIINAQFCDRLNIFPGHISGTMLAGKTGVSRQVVVQDIALLRTEGNTITATTKGYLLEKADRNIRLFKVYHENERTEEELNLIVDMGGTVLDVMVNHKIYGKISAPLDIKSRRDVQNWTCRWSVSERF